MAETRIAVLGECVADAFVTGTKPESGPESGPEPESGQADGAYGPDSRTPQDVLGLDVVAGGGPANTAVALARLGTPTRYLGRLSHDVFGRLFRDRLAGSGVDLSRTVAAADPSTLAIADIAEDGSADYSFHAEGTADWQWTEAELAAAAEGPMTCLHTGSLALVRAPGGAAIERLLAAVRERATISVDPNVRPLLVDPAVYREALPRWCAVADILRLSDDDLAHLLPGAAPEEAADTFHGYGARLVVITLGGAGVLASLDGVRVRVAAPPTNVVDTVGAGDTFTAGLLHALSRSGALGSRLTSLTPQCLTEALTFGARAAAAVVATRGANPPWPTDLPTP